MLHEAAHIVSAYPDEVLRDRFYAGHSEGWNIARMTHEMDVCEYLVDSGERYISHPTSQDWASYVSECEVASRDFSPGEFLCAEINGREDSEAHWEAWEAGVRHGAEAWYWYAEVCGEGAA